MDTPFPYDKFVTGKDFIGRKSDCTILSNLLSQGEHAVLIEPPRAGKTSLIQQALFSMRFTTKVFTVGQFSVLNIRTVDEFLLRYGSTAIRMVASTPDEYTRIVESISPAPISSSTVTPSRTATNCCPGPGTWMRTM